MPEDDDGRFGDLEDGELADALISSVDIASICIPRRGPYMACLDEAIREAFLLLHTYDLEMTEEQAVAMAKRFFAEGVMTLPPAVSADPRFKPEWFLFAKCSFWTCKGMKDPVSTPWDVVEKAAIEAIVSGDSPQAFRRNIGAMFSDFEVMYEREQVPMDVRNSLGRTMLQCVKGYARYFLAFQDKQNFKSYLSARVSEVVVRRSGGSVNRDLAMIDVIDKEVRAALAQFIPLIKHHFPEYEDPGDLISGLVMQTATPGDGTPISA